MAAAGGASVVALIGACSVDAGAGLAEETSQQETPAGGNCTVAGAAPCVSPGHIGHAGLIMGAQQDTSAAAGMASTAMDASSPTNFAHRIME